MFRLAQVIFDERVDEIIDYLNGICEVEHDDALYDLIMACYREDLPYDHKEHYSGVYDGFMRNDTSSNEVEYKGGYEVGMVIRDMKDSDLIG